jgi:hypothetical protein
VAVELKDNTWYCLPDGTRVQARKSKSPPFMWALIDATGKMPLYGFIVGSECSGAYGWKPEPGGYRIVVCDLTLDDLTLDDPK